MNYINYTFYMCVHLYMNCCITYLNMYTYPVFFVPIQGIEICCVLCSFQRDWNKRGGAYSTFKAGWRVWTFLAGKSFCKASYMHVFGGAYFTFKASWRVWNFLAGKSFCTSGWKASDMHVFGMAYSTFKAGWRVWTFLAGKSFCTSSWKASYTHFFFEQQAG